KIILGHEKLALFRCVKEGSGGHGLEEIDFDPDSDFDPEETKLDAHSSRQCSLTLGCGARARFSNYIAIDLSKSLF
ncbi:MAG: hypothetical protein R6V25_15145, partial [Desulfatiglandales bacterium]